MSVNGGKADVFVGKADIAHSDAIHIHNLFALLNYLSRNSFPRWYRELDFIDADAESRRAGSHPAP